ncbi:hypothetical protein BIV57_16105 [Mangrovactinospora gilvigrisea]|uniref:VWFA domain-containing protein n=1 Tax=Mangrovactinospora gilvigrisea TaxID=1428644 RepID=A0A1J7BCQ6_9ACTN|nr:VWA domain-containing protein [Mangrovactinospora gilvigrisea]OIV36487.1 hypothetical protein BIV57_16105 [Mangrovactinospora gilvigrisea]
MARLSKSNLPAFAVEVFQNEYLPEGGREVHGVVTVTASGGGTASLPVASEADSAVVIMVDCSGSMDWPATKMSAAREATAVAIDTVRDGVAFAVVAGTHEAREVYPGAGRMATADSSTRAAAKASLGRLSPGGGTAIGTWLSAADRLLTGHDGSTASIKHGILLTDGNNEHESETALQATLDRVQGHFTCDCRGVGTDWKVDELRRISSALLGSLGMVAEPEGLAEDFRDMMENAMGKAVADVALRLWTPASATVKFVKQVSPTIEDLTQRRNEAGPRQGDYPTGSWGDESRDYHVCVLVNPANVGQEMLAGRVTLVLPQPDGGVQNLAEGHIRAVWTGDAALSTRINPQVAHYTGQADLAANIREGLDARKNGDLDTATAKLGKAVALAHESGNEDTARLLARVVDVEDPATGTVRLKGQVSDRDEMELDTVSTVTARLKKK